MEIEHYERIHQIAQELRRVPEIKASHPLEQEDAPKS